MLRLARRTRTARTRTARTDRTDPAGAPPRGRRRLATLALFLTVMLGCGVAVASWLVDGTGPAQAKAATVEHLTVTAGTPTDWLYPGSTGTVYAVVDNPNSFPVQLTAAALGAVTTTPQPGQSCPDGSVTVSSSVTLPAPVDLPAGARGVAVTIPNALQMSPTAPDGCQGATFTVTVTLSGATA